MKFTKIVSTLLSSLVFIPMLVNSNYTTHNTQHTVITVPLQVNCSSVPHTIEAVEALKRLHACGNAPRKKSISPNDTVYGNCGTLSLFITNEGGGDLLWHVIVTSVGFPITSASYVGNFTNWSQGWGPWYVSNAIAGYNSYVWSDYQTLWSGVGNVQATVSATDTLWFGIVCGGTGAQSQTYVS